MVASSVLFAAMSLLIRLAEGVSPLLTSLARFAVGVCVVASMALLGRIRLEFRNTALLLLRGITGGIAVYLFFLSINTLGIARGSVISNSYPLFAAVGGVLLLGERVSPLTWFSLGIGLGGLVVMRVGDLGAGGGWSPWYLLATAGSISAAFAVICIRRLTLTDSSPAIFMAQSLVGFWMVVVPALATPSVRGIGTGAAVALLLLGIGLSASAAQLLMTWSYRNVEVATGSLLSLLTPALNVLVGVTLFREPMGALPAAGMGMVILGCVLGVIPEGRRRVRMAGHGEPGDPMSQGGAR